MYYYHYFLLRDDVKPDMISLDYPIHPLARNTLQDKQVYVCTLNKVGLGLFNRFPRFLNA